MKKPYSESNQSTAKKKVVTLSIFGGIVVVFALAVGLPYTRSDGTENFTGKELRLAKQALGDGSYAGNTNPIPDLAIPFKIRVTAVYKQEPFKACGGTAQGYGTAYVAEIAKVTFFGIEKGGYTERMCVF